jgi:3-hydroxyisobutyrate dehydrogenase-like beta-hydroxyacid dehydrogenase
MTVTRVAVLGLGSMGSALADALLAGGAGLTVWNRSPARAAAFDGRARKAATAAEAIADSEAAVLCVLDQAAALSVLQDEAVAAALAGRCLIRLTGATPEQSRATAMLAEAAGAAYLDGSILSYPDTIRRGGGQIVYSGDRAAFTRHGDLLAALGGPLFVGETPGTCFVLDKAAFVVLYGALFSFCQGAAMADAAGIPLDVYREVAAYQYREMAGLAGWFTDMMARRSYGDAAASVAVSAAAFEPVAAMSRSLGVDDALPRALQELFARGLAAGRGDEEMAAFFEILRRPDR